jgi:hypothetical protein
MYILIHSLCRQFHLYANTFTCDNHKKINWVKRKRNFFKIPRMFRIIAVGRPRRRRVDNIKMDLKEIGWDDMDLIDLAQDRTSGGLL